MKSTTGFVLCLNESPVDWSSHLQATVAGSSHDAEMIAMAACVADIQWVRGVLTDLLEVVLGKVPVWVVSCDNRGAIDSVYRGRCASTNVL